MRLYHFTHSEHLPRILAAGRLLPSESNVGSPYPVTDGPEGLGVGPDVVWLLDTPTIEAVDGEPNDTTHGLYAAKRAIRFEVDVPAIRWKHWAPGKAMSPDWREIMVNGAGGMERANHWYVFPAPIRQVRWLSAHNMVTDEPIEF